MMRKRFLMLTMVLLWIFAGMNTMRADDETTIYLASLKAQKSPASTGDGQVRLTWLDMTGKPFVNSIGVGPSGLNPTNPVPENGYATTAQMIGGTLIAIDGMETPVEIGGSGSQIYMTCMVYFHPEGQPANGSYLADWTFTDAAITRMNDPMGDGSKERPYSSPCFKVLPAKTNSSPYPVETAEAYAAFNAALTEVTNNPNNIYAVFNKYLLGNPVAPSANLEAALNATQVIDVTVEVDGDAASLDVADFASFSFTNNESVEWSYDMASATKEVLSAQKSRYTIPVTYTYKNTGYGLKNTTMTVSMAGVGASSLNIAMSVNALNPTRPEAIWFDGQTEKMSGDLTGESGMLSADISTYANPILKLNKQHTDDITLPGKTFAFDLNGNTAGNITIDGGEVTIAYSKYGGSAAALSVTGGKAVLNGGTFASLTISDDAIVEQNGATITGAATNEGTLTTTEGAINGGLTSSKTLILNGGSFAGANAVTVSGGTALINRGTLNGTVCGLLVSGGKATVKKQAVINSEGSYSASRTAGTLNIESGKFGKPLNGSVNFTSGFFKDQNYGVSAEDYTEMLISAGVEYNEGYRYFLGDVETAKTNGVGVCRIGEVSYVTLEDAIAYANNNPGVADIVIFMTNDYTLPAGYYTLPANATIVVPMSDTQEKEVNITAPRVVYNDQMNTTPYSTIQPVEFRRLTFASGVNMNVFGDIELTCSQYASNEAYTSQPCGAYGRLVMEEGSRMVLQNGSELRAWGFMTGKGETDARRGAVVREMFQMGDWKGAMTSVKIVGMVKQEDNPTLYNLVGGDFSDKKIFPVTQYFIQNVESPVKYHPGSLLSTSATVSEGLLGMSVSMAAPDIGIVGVSRSDTDRDAAIFLMDEKADADNTWVRKWYDAEHDIQVYDINSAAHIGSMLIDMGDINLLTYGSVPIRLNSAMFDLPLTCNFKIHLLSGSMNFLQNTCLLPGAEVEVDKEATVSVEQDEDDTEHTGALYVYDAVDWGKYAYPNAYTKTVRYTPGANGQPTVREEQTNPASATINVHGKFETETGFVYTSEHGANIISSNEDAGTFVFSQGAATGTRTVYQVNGIGSSESQYESRTFYPAKLKNGIADPAYANTSTAEENDAYCYQDNRWNIMKVDEDDPCFMKDGYETYYAKPQEYVAVVATVDGSGNVVGNDDHTYSDAAGTGRLFILMGDNCQWWEVEKKDNLYHCTHPDNDTYYYWQEETITPNPTDPDNPIVTPAHWAEKTYTITWKNWDGEIIQTKGAGETMVDSYVVTYGTVAEFLGTNPTRESNIDYTYDFTGWSPALGKVTSDVTYTATYEQKDRMYTVIFCQEGGVEIERQFLKHNDVPVCENTPTRIGHTLEWSPAIAAVTGDATYTATWLENPPTEYQITFVDYDGDIENHLLWQGNVAVGTVPTPPADPTGKPATSEYTYVFDHWSPALEAVSATSVKTYTAVYREVAKTYTVIFQNEDGSEIERHEYAYGEMPVCSATPTKANTAQYTYSFAWTPQIQTVMASEEPIVYRATFTPTTNKYSVTVKCSPSGAAMVTGGGIYNYDGNGEDENNILITVTPNEDYINPEWSDGVEVGSRVDSKYTRTLTTLTSDVDLVISFTYDDPSAITITWKSEDGLTTLKEVGQKANTATTYTGSTPKKTATAAKSFIFYGWSTQVGTEENEWNYGTIYKNGMTPKATAAATYYAYFTESARTYDVVWMNEAGTVNLELDYDQPYGAAIAFNSATPTKTATEQYTYTFDGWSAEVGGDVVELPETVEGDATFYAHFISTPIVSGYNLVIGVNDKETLAAATTKDNLIITSNGVTSGQLINANNLTLNGEAIFRMEKTFASGEWYAVAVPWTVEPATGIYGASGRLALGSQIYVIEFDANAYAGGSTNTFDYWKFLHETGADMVPGKLYMIYLTSGLSQLNFYKKAGAAILTTETSVAITGGDGERDNWNAIANPALFHADLSTGVTRYQTYDNNDEQTYTVVDNETENLIVAKPIFVQVTTPGTVLATVPSAPSAAPRRAPRIENDAKFIVEIARNGKMADRLIIETTDEKEDKYVIGQDLAKFGVSSKVAQMWVNRYDTKLCANAAEMVNDRADYPLSIFAPVAGEYTIHSTPYTSDSQYNLYLTYNGEAIWNLSDVPYTLTLEKGTSAQYGLRISARKAPEVATGMDEAVVDAQGDIRKVLINDQVFIIRGEKVYTIDGQLVK